MTRLRLDPLTAAALAPAPRRRVAPQPPPLEPEEERSLLETGLGAVEYIGRTLDKPGAAARGVIHGLTDLAQGDTTPEWGGGLANLIPFSDTMGITDPNERVTGRDLWENAGIAPKNKPGLFNSLSDAAWDVGGFATEVATDPLLYLTGPLGTLTREGKAAKEVARGAKRFEKSEDFLDAAKQFTKQAGRGETGLRPLENPATLIDQLRSGERSSLGLKMPLAEDAAVTLRDLPGGTTLDNITAGLLEKLHYGGGPVSGMVSAPMRALRSGLDVSAQGQFAPEAQRMADMAWTEARRIQGAWEDFAPTAAAREGELLAEFQELAKHSESLGGTSAEQAYREFARYAAEMPHVEEIGDVAQLMGETLGKGTAVTEDMARPFYEYFDQMTKSKDLLYKELDKLGGNAPDLAKREFMAKHVHRRASDKRSKIIEPRDDLFVNVPGGTRTLMQMSQDETLTAWKKGLPKTANGKPDTSAAANALRQKMRAKGITYQSSDEIDALQEKWIAEGFLEPELLKAHGHGTIDNAQYQELLDQIHNPYQIKDANGNLKTLKPKKEQFRKYWEAQPIEMRDEGIFARQLLEDQQSYMKDLVGRLATMREVHAFLEQPGVLSTAGKVPLTEAWKNADYKMGGLQTFSQEHPDMLQKLGAGIDDLAVSERVARSLKTYHQLQSPKAQTQFIKGLDQVTAAYKWGLTAPFPSFHARNRLSGIWQAWSEGNAELGEIIGGSDAIAKHLLWQSDPTKGAKLPDEFLTFLKTNDLLGANQMLEYGAKRGAGLEEINPLRNMLQPLKGIKGNAKEKLNPFNMHGVNPAVDSGEVAENVLAEMSNHAFQYVEALNRAGYAKALWDKGYKPSEIANYVRRTQFDYCVDEETEILTNHGWKKYTEINEGDLALTLDPETRDIDWGLIENVNVFTSPGELTHIKTNRFDAMVTDKHRWLAVGSGIHGGHYTLRNAKQHFATTKEVLSGHRAIIAAGGNQVQSPDTVAVYSDHFVDLIGWYITEGSNCQTKYGILIAQSQKHNPRHVRMIRGLQSLYKRSGATASEYAPRDNGHGPIVTFYFGRGIGDVVRDVCPNKQLTPRFLMALTTRQKKRLLKTLVDADGHRKDGTEIFSQKDTGRCRSFQMLAAMLGIRSNMRETGNGCHAITLYRTDLIYTDNFAKKPEQVTKVKHDGMIWCPTTPTGTWMARRNGTTYWTGNSELTGTEQTIIKRLVPFWTFAKKNLPYQLKKLAERPGGRTAQTFRAMSQYDPEEEYTPAFLKEQLAIRSPFKGDVEPGEETFMTQSGITPIEQFNQFTAFEPGGAGVFNRRSAQKLASNLHPLLVAGLRQFTGEDPFSGRELKSLKSTTESLGIPLPEASRPYVDRIIQGSPLSRAFSEAAGVEDITSGRKHPVEGALDMLTGMRFATHDIEKAKASDLANAQQKLVESYPQVRSIENFYVPKDMEGPKADEAREVVDLLRKLIKSRSDLWEKKKAEKAAK